jgi:hypothetical protein
VSDCDLETSQKGGGLDPIWAVAPQKRKGKERKGKERKGKVSYVIYSLQEGQLCKSHL